jgi:hypothetical protein
VHGEGDFFGENPLIGLRKRDSHSERMASEEGLSLDEKKFQKNFPFYVGAGESFVRGLLGMKETIFG